MIHLQGVSKRYPTGLFALRDVSLFMPKGEFVFLIGPTGAGKSTLLRLLYRADIPTQGHITVGGEDIGRLHARQIPGLRRSMGVVFQDCKLLPRKTAYENVAFALQVLGTPPYEIRPRALRALEVVGLVDRADAFPWQLSGGEQQRVSIARALVNEPPLLLADEPTGNLDESMRDEIMDLLEGLWQEHTLTFVLVTHDSALARRAPRLATIRKGRVTITERAAGAV